jgi:hypothetical protein
MIKTLLELIALIRTLLKIIKDLKDESDKARALKEINESFIEADADKLNATFARLFDKK